MGRRWRRCGRALFVLAALVVLQPARVLAQPDQILPQGSVVVDACEDGAPEGWEIVEGVNSASDLGVTCNFLATRSPGDSGRTFVSGVAITIEYFCKASEARETFGDKTDFRDAFTSRSATKVVTEEGPAANTSDNPQPDPIQGFGPELYDLQEKAWELLSPQILATIYTLTDERGAVSEDERFGVSVAEPAAVVIANNHLPTVCAVSPIGGAGGAGGGRGGGPGPGTVVVIGGIVAVGGVVIWKRKPGRPRRPPPSGISNVPPQCVGHSTAYESTRTIVHTLREAFQDLSDQLLVAERNQQNNIMKTHMIMGFEVGQYVGGIAEDFAKSLRPKNLHTGPVQSDTWKPPPHPDGLTAKMSAAFRSATDVLERAGAKVAQLRNRLREVESLGNLAAHPVVEQAEHQATAALNALRRGEQALSASTAARTALDALDSNIERVGAATSANFTRVEALENNVSRFRGFITEAEGEIVKLTETIDGANPSAVTKVNPKLAASEGRLASMQRQLQRDLDELGPLAANHRDALKNLDELMHRRDAMMGQLARHGDVLPKDVDALRRAYEQATGAVATARSQVIVEKAGRDAATRAALRAAEMEQSLAEAYLKGLHAQLERSKVPEPSLGKRALHGTAAVVTLPLMPIAWLIEKGFGTVQSVPEALEVLIRGQKRITEMTHNLHKVERALDKSTSEAQRLRQVLQQCIDAAKVLPPPSPEAAMAASTMVGG